MKRVMSAPVGALRASQQQIGPANSSAGAIGTAAYHPRSPNVALDPVRSSFALSSSHVLVPSFHVTIFSLFDCFQFQHGSGARGSTGGGAASIYGKVPSSAQGLRDRSGMGGGAGGAGRSR